VADGERALRLARASNHLYPEVQALIVLADARRRHGERTAALTYANSALSIAKSAGFRLLEAQAATELAEIYADQGVRDAGLAHAQHAVALHRECRSALGEAWTEVVLAQLHWPDSLDQATVHAAAATALFERVGAPLPAVLGRWTEPPQPAPRQRRGAAGSAVDNGRLAKEGSTP
jgi:ATP/maltotriose-dependent transcriptional regulator MalT